MIVPASPERFLLEFLPALVADIGIPSESDAGGRAAAASDASARRARRPAGAGIAVRVVGAGEWTLRLADRALHVSAGIAEDVALQLTLSARDFEPLVVAPMRRALAEASAGGAAAGPAATGARALAARSFWTRLGRFDEETADLLRQQQGRILVRIDDAGTSRNVALTPGLQPYSLDSAECCIDCEIAALQAVQDKRKNPLDLFYEGQIRIQGDAQIALAMAGLFL